MTKELWINLPVTNVAKSVEFFTQLGFTFNAQHATENSACMLIGSKNIVVMLFANEMFKGFVQGQIKDTSKGVETLLSFDAESKEEVDDYANKALAAGGNLFAPPTTIQGWMYGCAFADLDGHKWNVLYMDRSKMGQ